MWLTHKPRVDLPQVVCPRPCWEPGEWSGRPGLSTRDPCWQLGAPRERNNSKEKRELKDSTPCTSKSATPWRRALNPVQASLWRVSMGGVVGPEKACTLPSVGMQSQPVRSWQLQSALEREIEKKSKHVPQEPKHLAPDQASQQ